MTRFDSVFNHGPIGKRLLVFCLGQGNRTAPGALDSIPRDADRFGIDAPI